MNPKTNVKKHNDNLNYHYGFNNFNIPNTKPNIRTQVPNPNKSPNKTSKLGPTNKQPNKPQSKITQLPPINPEANKFQNAINEKNNPFYESQDKVKPKTEINRDKIDIDGEYKNNIGTAINAKKNNKINKDNLPDKKKGKALTTINKNKKDFGHEKDKNNEKPKTEIKKIKINLDTSPKINQNKNKNQVEKGPEENNLYINSINDVRLPKELYDISFDGLKEE